MKEVFKQLIIDFHTRDLATGFHRPIEIPVLPGNIRKAIVLVGMRRSGKTWTLYQIMNDMLKAGLSKQKLLYIDFSDDRLVGMDTKDWQSLLDAYFELYPELIHAHDLKFFFDEVHDAPDWQRFIRRLLDTENIQLYLSGSSAKLLSKEIATELRGRCLTREIFPFSFSEYLSYKEIDPLNQQASSKQKAAITHHLEQYLKRGGFPETLQASAELHRELIQGYVDTVIHRDIIDRYKIKNAIVLKRFIVHCLQNAASPLSINKIYNTFKGLGLAVSKDSLYAYLDYFDDACCLFSVPAFEFSGRKAMLKSKKVYPVDTGLITAYTIKNNFEQASRLETAVFGHLRRKPGNIAYLETKSGFEVDFVVQQVDGSIELIQVCVTLQDENTQEREVRAIAEAMQMFKIQVGTIVTLDPRKEIQTPHGTIYCVPALEYFL